MSMLYDLMIKIGVDTSDLDSAMQKAKDSVGGFSSTAKGVFAGNLLYDGVKKIGSAMIDFGKDSIQTGMNFDKAMSKVQATMLKSNEEMENSIGSVDTAYGHFEGNLREFAQFLGENTAFSATQAAEALNYMALAGYSTQQSMDMLPNVLSLAAAGNIDLAKASDMVTDAQTAFGIDAERTALMVDEMAKAASTGNTSVEQLGDAFLVVGGLAKELNGGFVTLADGTKAPVDGITEMEIALTAMANAGVKGSEAGTHMRNMLMKLSSPTKEGAAQMEALGVNIFDTEGNMRSLQDIMGDLNGALGDLTQEEKIQAISELFNARDIASAEALLGAVEQDWDKIGESILDAEGAASEMADIQLDNLAGDVTLFQSALEGAQVAISDGLSPVLRKFVQGGTKLMSQFATSFKEGGLQGVVDMGIDLINNLASSIADSAPELIPAAMEALVSFSEGLRSNASRITDAGINLILTLARAIVDNLPTFIRTVPTIISNIAGVINDNAPKLIGAGIEIIAMLAQGIIDSIPVIIEEFPKIIRAIFDLWMAVNWLKLGSDIIKFIVNGIKTMSEQLPLLMQNIGSNALTFIRNLDWVGMGRLLIQLIVDGVTAMITALPIVLQTIGMMALSLFSSIDWIGLGSSVITFIVNGITALISAIPDLLMTIGTTAVSYVQSIDWVGLGLTIIKFIVSGITALFTNIPNVLRSIGSSAMSSFRSINWGSVGRAAVNFIASGIRGLGSSIRSALTSAGRSAMSAFRNINWSSLGSNIISGIVGGISGAGGALYSSLRSLASSALSAAKSALKIGSPSKLFRDEVGKWIPAGIAEGVDLSADMVDDAVESLASPPDFDLSNYEYEIDGENGSSKDSRGYSKEDEWILSDNNLADKVDRLISLLEYYLPKRNYPNSKELDRMLGVLV